MSNQKVNYEHMPFPQKINTINTDFFPDSFPVHWHKYIEIIHLPKSANNEHLPVFQIQQKEYRLCPGDLLIIWSGELHEILENSCREVIGVQFAPVLLTELPDFSPYLDFFRTFHHIQQKDMPELAQNLGDSLEHMLHLKSAGIPFYDTEMLITLYEMFIHFGIHLRTNEFSKEDVSGITRNVERIQKACHFIAKNCRHTLTLETAANHIGFSPCYFSRTFKAVMGCSFVEYLGLQRIKQAQILLADPQLSITEAAYQSGFHSISTFNRVFHAEKGCSPSEYRRYYLEEHPQII